MHSKKYGQSSHGDMELLNYEKSSNLEKNYFSIVVRVWVEFFALI